MITLIETIRIGLSQVRRCFDVDNGVLVNTDCMYPGNGIVQVSVMGAGSSFFVTDRGGAIRVAEMAGAEITHHGRAYVKHVKMQGLEIAHGTIRSPNIGIDEVPAAILLVANASKEFADALFDGYRLAKSRSFKELVRAMLKAEFADRDVKEDIVIGSSQKAHTFENVVTFLNGSKLIVDPVLNDANSINSRLVANLDIKHTNNPHLIQRIVYDDDRAWQASDLNLLGVSGVPIVPFSKSEKALKAAALH